MTGILSVLIGMASVAGVPGTLEDIYGDTGETFQGARRRATVWPSTTS